MSIPRVSKFPVGAIMDRLQTESHRFQLSDDNRRVKAIRGEGASGQHRRPSAAIPESSASYARVSMPQLRGADYTSNTDAGGTLTLHAENGPVHAQAVISDRCADYPDGNRQNSEKCGGTVLTQNLGELSAANSASTEMQQTGFSNRCKRKSKRKRESN